MNTFDRQGITFAYRDEGRGMPFVFQHGLGGDAAQTFALVPPPSGVRMATLECRGHGETRPLGAPERLRFDAFADDVVALLDHLGLDKVALGGISMGAGVALNLARRFPERVRALVLVRPAWLDTPLPEHMRVFLDIAQLLRDYGPALGQARFRAGAAYRDMAASAPDAAASLLRQFESPRAVETLAKLEQLPRDAPVRSRADLARCGAPALVLLNRQDPLHPYALGLDLARSLPQARVLEIPSKSASPERHGQAARRAITAFLEREGSREGEALP